QRAEYFRVRLVTGLKQELRPGPETNAQHDTAVTETVDAYLRHPLRVDTVYLAERLPNQRDRLHWIAAIGNADLRFGDADGKGVMDDFADDMLVGYGNLHAVFVGQYRETQLHLLHEAGHALHRDRVADDEGARDD